MRNVAVLVIVAVLCCGCVTRSQIDEVDWDTILEKAETSLEMAHQVYALWELTHELIGTPEAELAPKREAFQARITEAENYLAYVREMIKERT